MQKNDLYNFIFFGTAFRFLQDLKGKNRFDFSGGPRENIQVVLNFLDQNNMRVSQNAAHSLVAIRNRLDEAELEDGIIPDEELRELTRIVEELRPTILAEAQEVTAFFPREKRYNIEKLYSNIAGIIGEQTYALLPENAQRDFDEAGKCILLERPTAAAFHLMRGSECALKQLYLSVIKRKRKQNLMWGPMTDHLLQRNEITDALKGTLDNFRRGFRNPTAHPDTFYSVDSAQDLLGTSTQLVALIVAHEKYDRDAV